MKDNFEKIFNETINPLTKVSLADEKRLNSITVNNDEYSIIYNRDGLNPSDKNNLESLILENLSKITDPDKVILNSVSSNKAKVETKLPSSPQSKADTATHSHDKKGQLPEKKNIPNVKHVIAVSSCKGGVGKSTVAINLAYALKQLGKSVGVMDADIYGPSLPTLLGQEDLKPKATENNKILPFEQDGVKFVSFGHFIDQKEPVIWRGPMLGGVIKQFAFDTEWGDLDYLILDLPPGTGDIQLSISQLMHTDGAIVVSTPQQVALSDSIKGLKMFEKVKIPVLGMVENMSYFMPEPEKKYYIFGRKSVEEVAKQLETTLLASIPIDLGLCDAAEEQVPYMSQEKNKDTEVGKIYCEFASKIDALFIGNDPANKNSKKKGFLNRLLNK